MDAIAWSDPLDQKKRFGSRPVSTNIWHLTSGAMLGRSLRLLVLCWDWLEPKSKSHKPNMRCKRSLDLVAQKHRSLQLLQRGWGGLRINNVTHPGLHDIHAVVFLTRLIEIVAKS